MSLKPIQDQVIVLMGASSGIGRETALRLARRGAKLVVAARSDEGLATLVEEIRAIGGAAAVAQVADAADADQVQAVADRAIREFGRLDSWVQLAAVSLYAVFEDVTPDEFRQVTDINLNGMAYAAMAALPYLRREGRGAFIGVSSVLARRSVPYQSPYCASKHGVDGMLESLRMELMYENVPISVTNVMPAAINTPFYETARTKLGVQPLALPPAYDPGLAAEGIIYACEHPTRDMVIGGVGQALILGQRISPALMDRALLWYSHEFQKSDQPKPSNAPSALFHPVEGAADRVEGPYDSITRQTSLYTWLETHPTYAMAATGAVALAANWLARTLRA